MSDLLSRLKAGIGNVKSITWPGTETTIAMRVLSQQEHQDAAFATEQLFKGAKIDISMVTADEYESEKVTQLLYRALHDPEKLEEPICKTVGEFRKLLTGSEKKLLAEQYMSWEQECSPSPDNMSDHEFDQLLLSVKKNPGGTIGSITNLSTLRKLLSSLVDQPKI